MKIHASGIALAAALLLAGCGLPRPGQPATTTPTLRAQARAEAPSLTVLVNNEPAWDYMSARANETWTFSATGKGLARLRWTTDARLMGNAEQPTVRVTFPGGANIYVVRCTATTTDGRSLEREVRVLMPAPTPSLPPNPLPPIPLPPRP